MMKNLVVIVLALVALGIIAPAARADKYDDLAVKVAQLQKSFDDLEKLVKGLSYELQESKGFGEILKQISFEMKKSEAAISDLQAFEKRIDVELFPKLTNLETSVAGLVTSTKEKLDALAGRVFTVETNLDQFGVRVSTLEERTRKLMELQERVAKLEEMMGQMQGLKPGEDLKDAIKKVSDQVAAVHKSVQSLDGKVMQLSNRLSDKADNATVAKLEEKVSQLEKKVADAEGSSSFTLIVALLGAVAAAVALVFAVDP